MAIQKLDKDFFIDMDAIRGVRWWMDQGLVYFDGIKIGINARKKFDQIKEAFLWRHQGSVYEGKKKAKGDI